MTSHTDLVMDDICSDGSMDEFVYGVLRDASVYDKALK